MLAVEIELFPTVIHGLLKRIDYKKSSNYVYLTNKLQFQKILDYLKSNDSNKSDSVTDSSNKVHGSRTQYFSTGCHE